MKLHRVTVKNFKAIRDATIPLSDFTAIIGTNGSGKSSILQALHWMFQSARSLGKGHTLSEKNAVYMPSPDYRNAGYGPEYRNKKGISQLDISISAKNSDDQELEAQMHINSARNEGISVHWPPNNEFVKILRDRSKEFSSYIPGLAGIPLSEEKRTKLIVHRQAAAGDANTVLRNILLLLDEVNHNGPSGLVQVTDFASKVMEPFSIRVGFEESQQFSITTDFQTKQMRDIDIGRWKPLELAGIGFLQVIQIFTYLVYFKPTLLLVDEPDSHLHPATQERLIQVLASAAKQFNTQVILTTHSPSVARSLPSEASVVWMKDGEVQNDGNTVGRQSMGWGLLDKRILLLTEDGKTQLMRSILSQWPELERVVAIWPLHGAGNLPPAKVCKSLQQIFGGDTKIVLHRDRDFMMPDEATAFMTPYANENINVWLTKNSDIESYWCSKEIIKAHFNINDDMAQTLIMDALQLAQNNDEDISARNNKRNDIRDKIRDCREGNIEEFHDEEVINEYSQDGSQYVILGKTFIAKLREKAQGQGLQNIPSFGKSIPESLAQQLAYDLKDLLEQCLS